MTMTVNVMASKWREAYDEQRCLSACIELDLAPRFGFTRGEELEKISLQRLAGSPSRHPWTRMRPLAGRSHFASLIRSRPLRPHGQDRARRSLDYVCRNAAQHDSCDVASASGSEHEQLRWQRRNQP